MGLILTELGKKAFSFLFSYWRETGWIVAVVLAFLLHSSNTNFTICKASLASERSRPAMESKTETKTTASQTVRIVYAKALDGKPAVPCPDVIVDSNTLALVDAALKAPIPAPAPVPEPFWGIEVSASMMAPGFKDETLGVSMLAGPVRFGFEYGFQSGTRIGLGRRWMFR